MTRNGCAYQQRLWVPAISVTGGGALPTPKASDGERGRDKARARPDLKGRELATVLRDSLPQMLPTPRANDPEKRGNFDPHNPRNGLPAAVRLLPTPVACVANDGERSETWLARRERVKAKGINSLPGQMLRNDSVPTGPGTHLNPSFVEEMMGFPVGWTV
jgi:hypothetical protein